jgi:hypothetical protein
MNRSANVRGASDGRDPVVAPEAGFSRESSREWLVPFTVVSCEGPPVSPVPGGDPPLPQGCELGAPRMNAAVSHIWIEIASVTLCNLRPCCPYTPVGILFRRYDRGDNLPRERECLLRVSRTADILRFVPALLKGQEDARLRTNSELDQKRSTRNDRLKLAGSGLDNRNGPAPRSQTGCRRRARIVRVGPYPPGFQVSITGGLACPPSCTLERFASSCPIPILGQLIRGSACG